MPLSRQQDLAFHAGNLALLCLWAGRRDMARTLFHFQEQAWEQPNLGMGILDQVELELEELRMAFTTGQGIRN